MLFILNPALLLKPMLLLPPMPGRPAGEPLEKLLEAMPGLFAPLLPPYATDKEEVCDSREL